MEEGLRDDMNPGSRKEHKAPVGIAVLSPGGTATCKEVEMCITVRRVYDVKTKEQEFTTRLQLDLLWEMPPGEQPPPEEHDDGDWIPNWTPKFRGRGVKNEAREEQYTTEEQDGKMYVRGEIVSLLTLSEVFELSKFPNDCQDLTITLQSSTPSTQCKFIPPKDGRQAVEFRRSGMFLEDFELLEECPVTSQFFLEKKQHHLYSCVEIRVKVCRQCRYYIINVALIMFLICSFVLCAWAVHPGAISSRWGVDFTLILTAVAFKLILNDMLPRLSYLTTLDIYVLSGFIFLSAATFCHSVLPLCWHTKANYSALTLPPDSVEGEQAVIDADLIAFYFFAGVWALWNLAYCGYFAFSRSTERNAFIKTAKAQLLAIDSAINEIGLSEQPLVSI